MAPGGRMSIWTTRCRLMIAGLAVLGAACQSGLPAAPERQQEPPKVSEGGEKISQSAVALAILKGEATDRRKIAAAQALGKMAASGDRAALDGLVQVLGDQEGGRARIFAAMGLISSRSPEAVGPLVKVLSDRTEPVQLRKEAAFALGNGGADGALEPLMQALEDPTSAEVRLAASTALWAEPFRQRVPQTRVLLAILKDPEQPQFSRARAAHLLDKVGDATAVEPLIALLLQEPRSADLVPGDKESLAGSFYAGIMNKQRNVRSQIAVALGSLGDDRAVRPLLQVAHGAADDADFVKDAHEALKKIGKRVGLDPFVAAAKDQDPGIRWEAVTMLGWLRRPEAEGALTEALKDADPAVSKAAAAALEELRAPAPPPVTEKESSHDPANDPKKKRHPGRPPAGVPSPSRLGR